MGGEFRFSNDVYFSKSFYVTFLFSSIDFNAVRFLLVLYVLIYIL